jgi:LPXTG-motif cell wall-anchored protein
VRTCRSVLTLTDGCQIGAVVGVVALLLLGFWFWRRKKRLVVVVIMRDLHIANVASCCLVIGLVSLEPLAPPTLAKRTRQNDPRLSSRR